MLRLFSSKVQGHKEFFETYLNYVILVFIGKLSLSTLRWIPICQGSSDFSGFLPHFVLAKLVPSSIRVNQRCSSGSELQPSWQMSSSCRLCNVSSDARAMYLHQPHSSLCLWLLPFYRQFFWLATSGRQPQLLSETNTLLLVLYHWEYYPKYTLSQGSVSQTRHQ